jgi:hypothetical protein
VTRGEEMTRVYRGEVAPYSRDVNGRHIVRDVADTTDSHEGTVSTTGRTGTIQYPL